MPPERYEYETVVACRLAREAGEAILRLSTRNGTVWDKGSAGPVTDVEYAASELILAGLDRTFPEDQAISEEAEADPSVPVQKRVWYVDPLDGTREFIAGNDEYAVMIGLAVRGQPVLGAIYHPVTGQLFFGVIGHGAWLDTTAGRIPLRVSTVSKPEDLRLVASRFRSQLLLKEMCDHLGVSHMRRMGSVGLKVGLLLTGQADLYIGPTAVTSAWDTCAPQAVLLGGGGRMTDLSGDSLVYSPHDLKNRRGVVASNAVCHQRAVVAIAPLARRKGLIG